MKIVPLAVATGLIAVLLWMTPPTYAQQDAGTATPAAAPAPAAAPTAAAPATVPAAAPDLGAQLEDSKAAYDRLSADRVTPKKFLIAALIAALANLLLTLLKKATKLTKQGKKYLPWAAMALGLVVGVSSFYAMGTTFIDAVLYGGGGPGAIILQELLSAVKKDATGVATPVAGNDAPTA